MFKTLWNFILKTLFNVRTETNNEEMNMNDRFAQEYRVIEDINFTSIFANKLANYSASDSTADIIGDSKRKEMLAEVLNLVMNKSKKIIGMQLGYGGVCIVPYINNGKILYTLVEQDRLTIDRKDGEKIVGATLLADQKTLTHGSITETYFRWVNYKIENNILTITQKYTDKQGHEIDISNIPEWLSINPVEIITNVDRVLFGYIQSPVNNRIGNDKYGVPITYGCERTIEEIKECLRQIAREFVLSEKFIGVDAKMFEKSQNGKPMLPKSGLFKTFKSDEDSFFEEFSPDIRDSSYYNRLEELYSRLEKEIGVSRGVLTDVETTYATATEIKRAMYDTFTLVSDIRKCFERGVEDFIYACNVLANRYNLSPIGEYELSFNWDYSLLTDQEIEFQHYIQCLGKGIVKKEELRQWMFPSETLDESRRVIEELESKIEVQPEVVEEEVEDENDNDRQE